MEIKSIVDNQGLLFIPALIFSDDIGEKPYSIKFLVDTGASRTTILPADALRFGLNFKKLKTSLSEVLTISGATQAYKLSDVILAFHAAKTRKLVFHRLKSVDVIEGKGENDFHMTFSVLGIDALKQFVIKWGKKPMVLTTDINFKKKSMKEKIKNIKNAEIPSVKSSHHIPYQITYYVKQMINPQIQLGTYNSSQNIIVNKTDLVGVNETIKKLQESIDELNLRNEQKMDLEADIKTIQIQIASSKPKLSIIQESLKSIKNILENTTISVISSELIKSINSFLGIGS